MTHWSKLSDEQLVGADQALRVLHTSPVFRGRALEIIREQHTSVALELERRQGCRKRTKRGKHCDT